MCQWSCHVIKTRTKLHVFIQKLFILDHYLDLFFRFFHSFFFLRIPLYLSCHQSNVNKAGTRKKNKLNHSEYFPFFLLDIDERVSIGMSFCTSMILQHFIFFFLFLFISCFRSHWQPSSLRDKSDTEKSQANWNGDLQEIFMDKVSFFAEAYTHTSKHWGHMHVSCNIKYLWLKRSLILVMNPCWYWFNFLQLCFLSNKPHKAI